MQQTSKSTSVQGNVWEEIFANRSWGRYPPEELVRFIGRHYKDVPDRSATRVLEVGCGPGANLWFLHREGYAVSGIDGSPTAIHQATIRLENENQAISDSALDLRVGDFSRLPWNDQSFDVVIDIHAIYANRLQTIEKTLAEVHRVLKPRGRFFAKMWGDETTGFGKGIELEPNTFDEIECGPCLGMGISHFFSKTELQKLFNSFTDLSIDKIFRTDRNGEWEIAEWLVEARK